MSKTRDSLELFVQDVSFTRSGGDNVKELYKLSIKDRIMKTCGSDRFYRKDVSQGDCCFVHGTNWITRG